MRHRIFIFILFYFIFISYLFYIFMFIIGGRGRRCRKYSLMHPILVELSPSCIVIRQGTKVWRNLNTTENLESNSRHATKSSLSIFQVQVCKSNCKKMKFYSNIGLQPDIILHPAHAKWWSQSQSQMMIQSKSCHKSLPDHPLGCIRVPPQMDVAPWCKKWDFSRWAWITSALQWGEIQRAAADINLIIFCSTRLISRHTLFRTLFLGHYFGTLVLDHQQQKQI